MKKFLIFLCCSFITFSFADKALQFFKYPAFIFDQSKAMSQAYLPLHFRIALNNVAGSGQFNKTQLIHATKVIKSPIYIVDLRQESHGFINNGTPISWYGKRNWLNKGLDTHQVESLEKRQLTSLSNQNSATFVYRNKNLNQIKSEEEGFWGNSKTLLIKNVLSEKDLVQSLGFHYERIAVTDHMAPGNKEVQRFLAFYRTLPPNAWLYFHCRGGEGRTTTFLAMIDILRNSDKDSLHTILIRQYKLGGSDLLNIDAERPKWFTRAAKQRLIFLKKFYAYVHSGDYAKGISWTA